MGENFHELVESKIFTEKNFVDYSLVPPNNAMPPNFVEKNFMNSHKTLKFTKAIWYVLNNACVLYTLTTSICMLTPNWRVCMVIHVLCMVNFEKAIKPTIVVTQNLACFPLHSSLS